MNNFLARKTPNGFSFTLTTYALKYLLEAEKTYGKRSSRYEYAGVELTELSNPQIWFPLNKFVVIQLTPKVLTDQKRAIFQISHEVIHVLSTNGKASTNNLEEGLATYNSKFITDRDTGDVNYALDSINDSNYREPYLHVKELLRLQPDALIELRKIQPTIGEITHEDFVQAQIEVPQPLIDILVAPMEY